jgi:HD-GYP domain-containing protein (c-di-GMP phosphodiesterase class II)
MVVESGQEFVTREFHSDPRIAESVRAPIPEGFGGACMPLHAAEKIVGVMFINVALPRELTSLELRILNTLASIGGNTINSMKLYEQTVKQLERLEALREIDLAISSSLDLRLTLRTVLEQLIKQLGVDAADVLLAKPGSGQFEYFTSQGFRTPGIKATKIRLGEEVVGKAALEREIIQVKNINHSDEKFMRQNLVADEGFVTYFAVPLIAKGEVKGILEIFHRSLLNPSPEWLNFLDSLSWQTAIAIDSALLFEDLQRSNTNLLMSYDKTIEGWSRALDLRDKETEGHTERVTKATIELAKTMGIPDEQIIHIWRGSMLHDIGKLGVPDNILLKPGKLTEEEWALMRRHPQFAYEMLKPINYLHDALNIPYYHHEKWDGSGYPHGLKGETIPLEARIFAVVDVWDALSNDRPYRPAWPREKVIEYIKDQNEKHFDPQVVAKFLALESGWQNYGR